MIGGRNRRVHRQPEAIPAGEDALVPPKATGNHDRADEPLHPCPELFLSPSAPLPCPSRSQSLPVSRRSIAVPSPLFPAI